MNNLLLIINFGLHSAFDQDKRNLLQYHARVEHGVRQGYATDDVQAAFELQESRERENLLIPEMISN
jgi:hypothetical protein